MLCIVKKVPFVILYDKWEEKTKRQRRQEMVISPDVLQCLGAFVAGWMLGKL